jgi:hypothetical protein
MDFKNSLDIMEAETMRFVKLGSTDMEVSVVAFGAWAVGGHWWVGND